MYFERDLFLLSEGVLVKPSPDPAEIGSFTSVELNQVFFDRF